MYLNKDWVNVVKIVLFDYDHEFTEFYIKIKKVLFWMNFWVKGMEISSCGTYVFWLIERDLLSRFVLRILISQRRTSRQTHLQLLSFIYVSNNAQKYWFVYIVVNTVLFLVHETSVYMLAEGLRGQW